MTEKLYVGNLTFTTTEAEVRQLFAQAGTVTQCEVIKDRDSGQSKGFAFVTMASPAEAQKAIGRFHGASLAGRKLTVNAARPREREPQTGGYQSSLGAFGAGQSGGSTAELLPTVITVISLVSTSPTGLVSLSSLPGCWKKRFPSRSPARLLPP